MTSWTKKRRECSIRQLNVWVEDVEETVKAIRRGKKDKKRTVWIKELVSDEDCLIRDFKNDFNFLRVGFYLKKKKHLCKSCWIALPSLVSSEIDSDFVASVQFKATTHRSPVSRHHWSKIKCFITGFYSNCFAIKYNTNLNSHLG